MVVTAGECESSIRGQPLDTGTFSHLASTVRLVYRVRLQRWRN
jgi:hypothetical protein